MDPFGWKIWEWKDQELVFFVAVAWLFPHVLLLIQDIED
jgi:hypothetical protein